MTQISNRSPILINLMKDVIPEEFDDVAISSFGPTGIVIESIRLHPRQFSRSGFLLTDDKPGEGRGGRRREGRKGGRTRVVR